MIALLLLAAVFTRPLERVTTLDPAMAQSVYDCRATMLIFESVLKIDYAARPYRLVPGVCELPEMSEDGLVYTFKIAAGRKDLVSPADIVRSLNRLRDPEIVSPNGWILKEVDEISAAEDSFSVRLKRPQRVFPWLMAMPCASVILPDGSGTGPYRLESWRKNHEMTFVRKVSSRRGFDTVRYLVVDDPSTQWLMFLKGEIDMLGEIGRDNWDAVVDKDGKLDKRLAGEGVRLCQMPTLESMYIGINMKDPVLGPNRKLRQALNCAFDYPEWEKFYQSRVIEARSPVPPQVEGAVTDPFAYACNLEKARLLLAEAGYPGGIDPKTGRRLVLTMAIGRASQDSREAGELLVAFFDAVGIKLELQFYTWDAFLKAVNEGRVQLYRMGWVGDYPDAENFLQLFHSRNVSPGPNHSAYENPEFDAAFDAGDYRKCQEIVREDCPWIFTHFNKANSLVRKRVGNYIPSDFPYGQEQYYEHVDD